MADTLPSWMNSSSGSAPLGVTHLENLYRCLQGALSPDVSTQKQAEGVLSELSNAPGFCSCLVVSIRKSIEDGF